VDRIQPFLTGSEEQLKLMERFFKVNVVSSPEGIAVTGEDETHINDFLSFLRSLSNTLRRGETIKTEDLQRFLNSYREFGRLVLGDVVTLNAQGKPVRPKPGPRDLCPSDETEGLGICSGSCRNR